MPRLFASLLHNEIAKAGRRALPRFSLFAVAVVSVIVYFAAGQLSATATQNAWGYIGFSMQMIFSDIGPVLIVSFTARLMAEETGKGPIRTALAAPILRWELYTAKAVVGLLYMLVISAAALGCSAVLGAVHYHFGPIGDSAGVVYSRGQALEGLLTAWVLSWIPLSALVMYGYLISVIVRNTGTAVSVGISSLFLIDLTKHLANIDPYVFTRYIDYPWLTLLQIAQGMDYQWRPDVWGMIALSGISAAVAFIAGLVIFVRQDLNH